MEKPKEVLDVANFKEGNISLIIDSYDDIFSSFDPRHSSQRALSDDFLQEATRASRDQEGNFELKLLVPKAKRNLKEELLIKRRLKNHFFRHYHIARKETKKIIYQGLFFVGLGIILMFIATLIMLKESMKDTFWSLIVYILQPAVWFLFWEGLGLIIFESKKTKPELDFNEKMARASITFASY